MTNGARGNGKQESKPDEVFKIPAKLERSIDQIDRTLATGINITLDFSACTFITVEGLEWLEEMMLRSESAGTSVTFTNLVPSVYKVFKVAHIDSLLKACGSPGPAVGPVC